MSGRLINEVEYANYSEMLTQGNLYEMDKKGNFFTWFNKQSDNPIYSRIDILIANVAWFQDNTETIHGIQAYRNDVIFQLQF